jgi:hypothetical protein
VKLEDHRRHLGTILINSETQTIIEENEPNIDIITKGGIRNGVDVDNPNKSNIYKEVLEDVTYNPPGPKPVLQ